MRYAVTGSAGFVGSHLCDRLVADGHTVLKYDRRTVGGRVELSTDPLDFTGCDGIFHLAASAGADSFGMIDRYARDNVVAAQRVFEAAAHAGVRVAFASSSTVYGSPPVVPTPEDVPLAPTSPYGVTKLAGEHLARASQEALGLDVVVLRLFTVYGPNQRPDMAFARIVEALRMGQRFELHGDGRQSRGFTYITDAVEALLLAMEEGEGTYNVGGGSEASLNDAISCLEELSGCYLATVPGPSRLGDERRTFADTTRIKGLGWRPQVELVDGLRAQWEAAGWRAVA